MHELPGGTPGQTSGTGQSYEDQAQRPGRPPQRPDRDDDDDRPGRPPQRPDRDDDDDDHGPGRPQEQGPNDLLCRCEGRCECDCGGRNCGLTQTGGTLQRLLEELEGELAKPPRVPKSPDTARKLLETAVQDAQKEYVALEQVVKKYREYHRKVECELESAKTWYEDLRNWCRGVCESEIKALWRDRYEEPERTRRCALLKAEKRLKSTRDCLEQANARVTWAREDYTAVKGFEETLKKRFADLKGLYDSAKSHVESNDPKAVCAILVEYRQVYRRLGELLLQEDWDRWYRENCRRPGDGQSEEPVKIPDGDDLRARLHKTLKALLVAQYCHFCWQQQRIEYTAELEHAESELEKHTKNRRENFIREARDVPCGSGRSAAADDEGGAAAAAGRTAGRESYESRPQAGDDDQNQP